MAEFWLKIPEAYNLIQIVATGGFLSKVVKNLPAMNNKSVLDLGCGTGLLKSKIDTKAYLGWDINPDFIKLANSKYGSDKAIFEVHDIVSDRLPKKTFDFVIIMNVLHHLPDKDVEKLFNKIKRWSNSKKFIIVESRPKGTVGKLLEKLDAGDNFRDFDKLLKIVERVFRISKSKIITAPLGTYEYLIIEMKI